MKISILISSYNKGKYIKECLESCLAQEDENFEIILFDNFSNDETNEILDNFKDRVKIFKSKKVSVYPAMNQIDILLKAFHISTGEIICLLDADDFFIKDKISKVRNFFENNNSTGILFDLPNIKKKNGFKKFRLKKKFFDNLWKTTIPTSSISLKRNFFNECIKIDLFKNFNSLEIDFRLNVISQNIKKNFEILNESLNVYRQVDEGIMGRNKKFSLNWWKKRYQAHLFMRDIYLKNNTNYKNLDFSITKIIIFFFSLIKY
jgi:glycosyltransferase involved in cell wall biosynthesis